MPPRRPHPWRPDSHQTASGKPGAVHYNEARTHQGRWCFGKTPMQTFLDSRPLAREKQHIGEAA